MALMLFYLVYMSLILLGLTWCLALCWRTDTAQWQMPAVLFSAQPHLVPAQSQRCSTNCNTVALHGV